MSEDSWLRIEGDTPGERVRNGLPQLAVVVVLAWIGALAVYEIVAATLGPLAATIAVVICAVAVAFDLRDRMIGSGGADGDEE